MGLGSCRVLLEQPDVLPTFDVRELAPDVPLLANLGAVQLNLGIGVDECRHLLHALRADALVLHLNPLQEALQAAGNTCFSGLLARIAAVCAGLGAPVIVKEVGWGIADDLVSATLRSRSRCSRRCRCRRDLMERGRAASHAAIRSRARVAAAFAGWGIPTADALIASARAPRRLVC